MTMKFAVKPYYKTPKRMRKTPLLTVSDIANKTHPATRKRSRVVKINGCRIARTPRFMEGWTTYRVDTTNMENKHRYIITIFAPDPVVRRDSKVIIDSPNPLHAFKYEFALARRGNSFIYRSNGQPPHQTNPGQIPGMDHHAYAALRFLVKESKVLSKPLRDKLARR